MYSSVHTLDSVSSQRIVHDQINRSHSKQQYTFPKQSRFPTTKKSYCKSAAYELGSTLNMRSTHLGYGKKSDFTRNDIDKPGPDRYSIVSLFQVENSKKKGYTFSLGRDEIKFRKIAPNVVNPGPGFYDLDDSTKSRKYLFSMGQRTAYSQMTQSTKNFPGPATYDLDGMNRTGYYFLSKFSGSKASVFSPPTSTRFSTLANKKYIPGPGAYNYETFTNEGKYSNSKLRSAAGGKFALDPRKIPVSKDVLANPGPGAYRVLSEFGDTDFPPIDGNARHQFSKSQSVQSFRNSSTIRSSNGQEKQSNPKSTAKNFYTDHSQPKYNINGNNSNKYSHQNSNSSNSKNNNNNINNNNNNNNNQHNNEENEV